MTNKRIWYAVKCWEEDSSPEDGIVSCGTYWKILHAPNVFTAYDIAKKRGHNAMVKYEDIINPETNKPYGYSRHVPDVRIATNDEVSEYLYDLEMLWCNRKRWHKVIHE